jgi:hypothetical protein
MLLEQNIKLKKKIKVLEKIWHSVH